MSFADKLPNISNSMMDTKDKLLGEPQGFKRTETGEILVDSITSASIVAEVNQLIKTKEKLLEKPLFNNLSEIDKSRLEWQIYELNDVKVVANAQRVNGPTSFVSQNRISECADVLARELFPAAQHSSYATNSEKLEAIKRNQVEPYIFKALGGKEPEL